MSPAKRQFILYLEDMLQSMKRIDEYIAGLDFSEFKMSYMVVDAVIPFQPQNYSKNNLVLCR